MSMVANDQLRRHLRNPRVRWGLAILALILIALVIWHLLAGAGREKGLAPITVKVTQATFGHMPVILNELGTVTPIATVTVVPNQAVSGYLTEVPFKEGEDIRKGQLLAQIDSRPYVILWQQALAQLAKDKALLAQARTDLGRYAQLAKEKSIADQVYVDQIYLVQQDAAAVQLDQATVAQYALDIAYCHITTPVSGRVGLRLVDPGNYITGSSNTGLAVVTTIRPTTVEFTVAQNDIQKVVDRFNAVGPQLPVTAFTSDNTKKLATGTLYALSNEMTISTGTVTLRATFPNENEVLYPSEFVNVQLLVNTLTHALLVPTPAVLNGAPGDYVYLVNENNTVSVRKVTLGPSDGKNTVIASGLQSGDIVVTQGTDRLSDGAAIKIVNPGDLRHGGAKRQHVRSPDR